MTLRKRLAAFRFREHRPESAAEPQWFLPLRTVNEVETLLNSVKSDLDTFEF
jgi:hypothetical protein